MKTAILFFQPALAISLAAALLFFVALSSNGRAQAPAANSNSVPTPLRVSSSAWWPTKGEAAREEYVGSEACFACHEAKSEHQQETAMYHAASRASDSTILRAHPHLTFQKGPFYYQLVTHADKSTLTVTSGGFSVFVDLLWALGSTHMGQTFVYQQGETFYESRLSFFAQPQGLDITPGASSSRPSGLLSAAGRAMPTAESRACFSCHTTAAIVRNQLDPGKAELGVHCESCHGPGAKHVAAASAKSEKRGSGLIFNPANLSRVDSVDFCGACHRTWQDVVSANLNSADMVSVRFAPYRLENSRCWAAGDARIACIACHDPHKPLVHDPGSYDSNCLACHVSSATEKRTTIRPGAACLVSTKNCVTCHMPRIELPAFHSAFADHWIRIVKPNSSFPE